MDPVDMLRRRGCWTEAAGLLAEAAAHDAAAAVRRAGALVEQCMFALTGWDEAAAALDAAGALVRPGDERGALECERATFAIAEARSPTGDGAPAAMERARAAVQRADAALADSAPGRARLEFIRGALAEADGHPDAAAAAYHKARANADDEILLSYVYRHLGGLAAASGETERAREYVSAALDLRERHGFAVGLAPLLVVLAEVSGEAEAAQLRSEAVRLIRAFGGLPVWLRHLIQVTV